MKQSKDSLGDRMKGYELPYKHKIIPNVPLFIRVDGKAFHTLTKNAEKPFDRAIMSSMTTAAAYTAREIQGCKAVYVQSDEATFLVTDYDTHQSQGWFNYDQQKIVSIVASLMSVWFNRSLELHHFQPPATMTPVFDARVYSVPRHDVINAFLWRVKDWERNSISMYCQSFFSAKQMHGQGRADQKEMLQSIGKSWEDDLLPKSKFGTFMIREIAYGANVGGYTFANYYIEPRYKAIAKLINPLFDFDPKEK